MKRLLFLVPIVATIKLLCWAASFSMLISVVLSQISFLTGHINILYGLIMVFAGFLGLNYYFHQKNVEMLLTQELLLKRLELIDKWEQAVTRLHHLSETLLDEKTSN